MATKQHDGGIVMGNRMGVMELPTVKLICLQSSALLESI